MQLRFLLLFSSLPVLLNPLTKFYIKWEGDYLHRNQRKVLASETRTSSPSSNICNTYFPQVQSRNCTLGSCFIYIFDRSLEPLNSFYIEQEGGYLHRTARKALGLSMSILSRARENRSQKHFLSRPCQCQSSPPLPPLCQRLPARRTGARAAHR